MARLLCLFLTLSLAAQAQNKWESTIQAFEKSDRQTPPPKAPILFVGSSSFAYWTDVQRYFPGKPILNRGFGGSELSDVLHYADRVILAYKPRQIVIYAGENDLAVGGKTPGEVCDLFVRLFAKIRQAQPNVPVVYVALKPSPSRWNLKPQQDETNRLIRAYLARQPRARFVDVVPLMLDPATGWPKPQLFKPDSLHMTAEGYALWAEALRPVLK
jgi:lysophospholipase L1-like esterase